MPMCTMRGETEGLIHETVRLAMAFFFCPEKAKTSLVLIDKRGFVLVDGTGLEPVTSCTSSRCSYQLS